MATFTDCWEQHASALSPADRQSIRDRASQYQADGLAPQDALRRSVQWHHDEAASQLASVHDQLRQQQYPELSPEPAAATTPTEVATPQAAAPASPEKPPVQTGVSSERFKEQYGADAPVANTGRSAASWQQEGVSRLDNFQKTGDVKDDPYAVLTNLRQGKVPVNELGSDAALLRAEHQRLRNEAINSEGTPQHADKEQAALDMANAIKEVAHKPFHDVGMSLQEYDQPRYDNLTDFSLAWRERTGNEMTANEKAQAQRAVNEVKRTRDDAANEVNKAQKSIGKSKMSFEDAAKSIRDQITELTKGCTI